VAEFRRAMSSKSKNGKDGKDSSSGSDCASDKAAQVEKN
jgi:hypothetical protein